MLKYGNQFYLKTTIKVNKVLLNIEEVSKIQFNMNGLIKYYPSEEVTYNPVDNKFYIWLSEEETFNKDNFLDKNGNIQMDIRIKFTNNSIFGSRIKTIKFEDSVNQELIEGDDSDE